MSNLASLSQGFTTLTSGTLWHNPSWTKTSGKCAGFADANPGEAQAIAGYVNALLAGQKPAPPTLATATGKGLVQIIEGGYGG